MKQEQFETLLNNVKDAVSQAKDIPIDHHDPKEVEELLLEKLKLRSGLSIGTPLLSMVDNYSGSIDEIAAEILTDLIKFDQLAQQVDTVLTQKGVNWGSYLPFFKERSAWMRNEVRHYARYRTKVRADLLDEIVNKVAEETLVGRIKGTLDRKNVRGASGIKIRKFVEGQASGKSVINDELVDKIVTELIDEGKLRHVLQNRYLKQRGSFAEERAALPATAESRAPKNVVVKKIGAGNQIPQDVVDTNFEILRPSQLVRLSWEPLPPGEWTINDVKNHYLKNKSELKNLFHRTVDIHRLNEISRLKPEIAYIGKEGWFGYTTFVFPQYSNVVLECPFEGNAVYVLRNDNWEKLAKNSKGWIRDHYQGEYKKIVHKGDWINRVKDALQNL